MEMYFFKYLKFKKIVDCKRRKERSSLLLFAIKKRKNKKR